MKLAAMICSDNYYTQFYRPFCEGSNVKAVKIKAKLKLSHDHHIVVLHCTKNLPS
jgi:hypothetical protein